MSGRIPGEFGPVAPPKSRSPDKLNGVSVCQTTAGPEDDEQLEHPPRYRKSGVAGLKELFRESESRSLLIGAEE